MDDNRIRIEGYTEVRKGLRAIDKDLVKQLKAVNLESAQMVAGTAKGVVPVLTGKLANTIRAAGTNAAAVVRSGNNGSVPYAGPIHFGWPKRHIAPQPFLYNAMDIERAHILTLYEQRLDALIDEHMS